MLEDGAAFALSLLASFIHVIGIFPPGNSVVLSDGSRGTVALAGPLIDRPTIDITHDPYGRELPPGNSLQIDLSDAECSHLSVVGLRL
jgi:hypothetical protein